LGCSKKSDAKLTSSEANQDIKKYLSFLNERRAQKNVGFLIPAQLLEQAIIQSSRRTTVNQ
jgi:hypothetical protein